MVKRLTSWKEFRSFRGGFGLFDVTQRQVLGHEGRHSATASSTPDRWQAWAGHLSGGPSHDRFPARLRSAGRERLASARRVHPNSIHSRPGQGARDSEAERKPTVTTINTLLGSLYVDDQGEPDEPTALLWPSLFTDHRMWHHQLSSCMKRAGGHSRSTRLATDGALVRGMASPWTSAQRRLFRSWTQPTFARRSSFSAPPGAGSLRQGLRCSHRSA